MSAAPSERPVGRALSILAGSVVTSVAAGTMAAGLVMPAVGAAGAVARESVDFFDSLPAELERSPLAQPSRMLAADGTQLAQFFAENRVVVPIDKMSPYIQKAIVATEDARFYEHSGIDPEGMARAFVNNQVNDNTQGASTLTQQYVKNLQIEKAVAAGDKGAIEAAKEQTYERKLREAKLAIAMEKELTKQEILEGYLNISLFGEGVYGVEAAARHFFNTTAADLTLPQAALLAGVTQSPSYYDPEKNPENALSRRNTVLGRMLSTGAITQAEYDEAKAAEVVLDIQEVPNGCATAGSAAFFCDYVQRTILNDPRYGETEQERRNLLYRGGLEITTTLDPARQDAASRAVLDRIPADDGSGLGDALASLEGRTGHIVAMAQNRTFGADEGAGITSVNYNTDQNMGQSGGVQPGSTFKPFVLAAWLEAGHTLDETVSAPGTDYIPETQIEADRCTRLGAGTWDVSNSEGSGGGRMSALEGTYRSVNTAYANMLRELDLCSVVEMAERLGVHRAVKPTEAESQREFARDSGLVPLPSIILGAQAVSPLTMASAHSTFSNAGVRRQPMAITKVVDSSGEVVAEPQPSCEQVISPEIANTVAYAMTQTIEQPRSTGYRVGIGRQAAGKTGTANNSTSTMFVGYTPQLTTAVWVGNPSGSTEMQGIRVNGQYYGKVYGATLAGPTWQQYMNDALNGVPEERFADPDPQLVSGSQSFRSFDDEEDSGQDEGDDEQDQDDSERADREGGRAPQPNAVQPDQVPPGQQRRQFGLGEAVPGQRQVIPPPGT